MKEGQYRKSMFVWLGGKLRLLKDILPLIENKKVEQFVEPFIGGAVVSMNVIADSYIWNDKNPDLINVYNQLKMNKQEFIDYAKQFFIPENNKKDKYLDLRNQFNEESLNTELRGALFMYLNKHGFNGMCRYNRKGIYNVPFGTAPNRTNKKIYFPEEEMQYFISISDRVTLLNTDFENVASQIENNAIVYCDPPYVHPEHNNNAVEQKQSFVNYTGDNFSFDDQERLVDMLKKLKEEKNTFSILSNHANDELIKLYQGFSIKEIPIQRLVAGKSNSRGVIYEIIASY